MHPVIRISIFLIFTYFIVQNKPGQLILAGFILFGASLFQTKYNLALMWKMVWRLKWFYISIFILFYFSSPNNIPGVSEFYGVYVALIKITALMLIVIAVIIFIISIPRPELIVALIYLSRPLGIVGFSSDRFAVRLFLIIEFAETIPEIITNTNVTQETSKIKKIVFSLSSIVNEIYDLAENSECKKIQYDNIKLPRYYQWSYLIFTVGLFYISDIIFTQLVTSMV